MATKMYCDACEKEFPPHLLTKCHVDPFYGDCDTELEADICKNCIDKLFTTFKQMRSSILIDVDFDSKKTPEKKSIKKESTKKKSTKN